MSAQDILRPYLKRYPHHQTALENLQKILDYQIDLAHRVEPGWEIDRAAALAQWRVGRPLLADNPMPVPPILFLDALAGLQALFDADAPLARTVAALRQTDALSPTNAADFLENLPADGSGRIAELAKEVDADEKSVALLLRTALSPLLARQAAPAREWLPQAAWKQNFCPVCGAAPEMARLSKENGQRTLACFWCQTEWRYPRLRCHHCQQEESQGLSYFVVEGDEAHRVVCCDTCHHYIKTIDERHLGYTPHLLVEDFLTAHLDDLAQEEGCL